MPKYRGDGYQGQPGIGGRPLQPLSSRPLAPAGAVPLSYPAYPTHGESANRRSPTPPRADGFKMLDRALAPYEADKSLIMTRQTFNELTTVLVNLPPSPLRQDYTDDLSMIYNWPRNLVKSKIARCMDPSKATNRDGFQDYLQWAADNELLPPGTSVQSVLTDFDKRYQTVTARRSEDRQPPRRQASRKDGKGTTKAKRGKRKDEDPDGAYRGRK